MAPAVHIPKQFRSKFYNKAVFGHMVGYVNEKYGYRVWVPSKNKIFCSHDVLFKSEAVCRTNSIIGHVDKNLKNIISKAKEETKYDIPIEKENEVENVIKGSNVGK